MFDRRRPDPQLGVFETMLVLDGRPVELDAHLARLESSLGALFPGLPLPFLDVPVVDNPYGPSTTGTSQRRALRIAVAPDGAGGLGARVEWRPAASDGFVSLSCLPLVGGLGEHKWVDRSLLDEAQAKLPDRTLPLIVGGDGSVLEASRANVFAVRDGALFTPPLDGRILPGITRARVLEIAAAEGVETNETELRPDDLLTADEVFLTGSVRGIERVDSLDGAGLGNDGGLCGHIATELWQVWAGAKAAP